VSSISGSVFEDFRRFEDARANRLTKGNHAWEVSSDKRTPTQIIRLGRLSHRRRPQYVPVEIIGTNP
jgi:hypothetical protein